MNRTSGNLWESVDNTVVYFLIKMCTYTPICKSCTKVILITMPPMILTFAMLGAQCKAGCTRCNKCCLVTPRDFSRGQRGPENGFPPELCLKWLNDKININRYT